MDKECAGEGVRESTENVDERLKLVAGCLEGLVRAVPDLGTPTREVAPARFLSFASTLALTD